MKNDNEDHPNLSPEINAWIKQVEANDGFAIKDQKRGDMFKATTHSGSVYIFVVTDPEKHEVAVASPENRNPKMREPQLCVIDGATNGGSMVKVGWIGIGSYLRMYPMTGGLYTITPIQLITLRQDPELARSITEKAETKRPKKWTGDDKKKAEAGLKDFIRKKFPGDEVERVEDLLNFFCWNGRMMMLTLLVKAHEAGKLETAFGVIGKQIQEHWGYRAPEIRGEFMTESDVYYMKQAYEKLGLPIPK